MINLDNAVKTALLPEILQAMRPFFNFSPNSPHSEGQEATAAILAAKKQIKTALGAKENDRLLFAPSHPIAINQVIQGTYYDITREYGKNHFLATQIDEAPALFALNRLENLSCTTTLLPVNSSGIVETENLIEELTPRTALLTVQLANGLLGTIQPLEEIQKICQDRGVLLHIDLKAAFGKIDFSLEELGADFATISSDTLFGPCGMSCLWIKEGVSLSPLILGSDPDAIGQLDPPLIVGLGIACQQAQEKKLERMLECARLKNLFENLLEKTEGVAIHFQSEERLPTTSVVSFEGVHSEALLFNLSQQGVMASIGGNRFQEMGHLMQTCGFDPMLAKSTISFTLSHQLTDKEITQAVAILEKEYQNLKKLSEEIINL